MITTEKPSHIVTYKEQSACKKPHGLSTLTQLRQGLVKNIVPSIVSILDSIAVDLFTNDQEAEGRYLDQEAYLCIESALRKVILLTKQSSKTTPLCKN